MQLSGLDRHPDLLLVNFLVEEMMFSNSCTTSSINSNSNRNSNGNSNSNSNSRSSSKSKSVGSSSDEEEEDEVAAVVKKCVIYQLDLLCKDENASLEEQGRHILFYYSSYCSESKKEEEAIQFSGFCQAISNFTTLLSNTTTDNSSHSSNEEAHVEQVHLSNKSTLMYIPLAGIASPSSHNSKHKNDNNIVAVVQIGPRDHSIVGLRHFFQKAHLLFQTLYSNGSNSYTNYYNKIIIELSNTLKHQKSSCLLHSIIQCVPSPSSLLSNSANSTSMCSKLTLKRLLDQLHHTILRMQSNTNSNTATTIVGASIFYNHTLMGSRFLPRCSPYDDSSSSSFFFENDDDNIHNNNNTATVDDSVVHLLYKHLVNKLIKKIRKSTNSTQTKNNSKTEHEDLKMMQEDVSCTTTDTTNTNNSHEYKMKKNKQSYCYYNNTNTNNNNNIGCKHQHFNGINNNINNNNTNENSNIGKFDLFTTTTTTTTTNSNDETYYIWAPKIKDSSVSRVVFFHNDNDDFSWNIMLYLNDDNDNNTTTSTTSNNNFICYSNFFKKLSNKLNGTIIDHLPRISNKSNSIFHSNTFANSKMDDGIHMVVSIDKNLGRSVVMMHGRRYDGCCCCTSNSRTQQRKQQCVLVLPEDKLRHTLANMLPQEVTAALDDVMNEIQSHDTNYSNNIMQTATISMHSGDGICEICTLVALSSATSTTTLQKRNHIVNNNNNVWICGRRFGDCELYATLDSSKYKTVRQAQYALSRLRIDILRLPFS